VQPKREPLLPSPPGQPHSNVQSAKKQTPPSKHQQQQPPPCSAVPTIPVTQKQKQPPSKQQQQQQPRSAVPATQKQPPLKQQLPPRLSRNSYRSSSSSSNSQQSFQHQRALLPSARPGLVGQMQARRSVSALSHRCLNLSQLIKTRFSNHTALTPLVSRLRPNKSLLQDPQLKPQNHHYLSVKPQPLKKKFPVAPHPQLNRLAAHPHHQPLLINPPMQEPPRCYSSRPRPPQPPKGSTATVVPGCSQPQAQSYPQQFAPSYCSYQQRQPQQQPQQPVCPAVPFGFQASASTEPPPDQQQLPRRQRPLKHVLPYNLQPDASAVYLSQVPQYHAAGGQGNFSSLQPCYYME
jgi:hypothetical protein